MHNKTIKQWNGIDLQENVLIIKIISTIELRIRERKPALTFLVWLEDDDYLIFCHFGFC